MDLIINNKIIDTDIGEILDKINKDLHTHYFRDRILRGNNLNITCPFHKGGNENHPSCNIYIDKTSPDIPYGFYRCFTCGESGNLWNLVARLFDAPDEFGKQWLVDNFGELLDDRLPVLPEIEITKPKGKYLSDDIIDTFENRHPYMYQRGLTDEVIDKFQIKYDKENDCIVFPVWDSYGRLVMLSTRSVSGKTFNLEKAVVKPVYLLYDIIKEGASYAIICESQINALYCQSIGLSAVATFGCNVTSEQVECLKKSGIRHFIIGFDGDDAGRNAASRLRKMLEGEAFVDVLDLPNGKDLNNLSKDEIIELLAKSGNSFAKLNRGV